MKNIFLGAVQLATSYYPIGIGMVFLTATRAQESTALRNSCR